MPSFMSCANNLILLFIASTLLGLYGVRVSARAFAFSCLPGELLKFWRLGPTKLLSCPH